MTFIPGAHIGENFFIDHGTGVVIGETCIIGRGCRLYQGVTLGALSFQKADDGTLVKGLPRHPILEDNVTVYAGASILGRITIGAGSVIGGNVWLTRSVPPGSKIVQASGAKAKPGELLGEKKRIQKIPHKYLPAATGRLPPDQNHTEQEPSVFFLLEAAKAILCTVRIPNRRVHERASSSRQ